MLVSKLAKTNEEELLIAKLLNKPKEFLIAHTDISLKPAQIRKFKKQKSLLNKGVPLAYIFKEKWFYSLRFNVNKNVLIPRPETEHLVELALEYIQMAKPQLIIDVGTGSGAIIISTYYGLIKDKLKITRKNKTNLDFVATDISDAALRMAKKNALGILGKNHKIKFIKSNLLKNLGKLAKKNVLMIANLPYLPMQTKNESIKYEPKTALYAGKRGLTKMFKLIAQASKLGIKRSCLLLEINFDQAKVVTDFGKKLFPHAEIKIYKDLAGLNRIVKIALTE